MIPPGRPSRPSYPDSEAPPPSAAAVHDGEARARAKDARVRSDAAYEVACEARDLAKGLVETLGAPPSPGRPGSGLVGEFMRLDDAVGALRLDVSQMMASMKALQDSLTRSPPSAPPLRRKRSAAHVAGVAAIVTALGGAGAALVAAVRGGGAPPASPPAGAPPPPPPHPPAAH